MTRRLTGLRVAPYYGCQFSRPMGTFDDPQLPDHHGPPLRGDGRRRDHRLRRQDRLLRRHDDAHHARRAPCASATSSSPPRRQADAEVIVAACPLCEMNLEGYQPRVNKAYGDRLRHPGHVLHPARRPGAGRRPEAARHRQAGRLLRAGARCGPGVSREEVEDDARREDRRLRLPLRHQHRRHGRRRGGRRAGRPSCPDVAVAREYKYMCSDPGQELIKQDIREHGSTASSWPPARRSCTSRPSAGGRRTAGSTRSSSRWSTSASTTPGCTTDRGAATEKAKRILARGRPPRAAATSRSSASEVPVNPDVLVVGGGIAGIQAALTLANAGKKVYLVEREPSIGGHMAMFDKTFPTLDCAACILTPKMSAVRPHPNITLLDLLARSTEVDGYVGNFKVKVTRKAALRRRGPVHRLLACASRPASSRSKVPERVQPGPRASASRSTSRSRRPCRRCAVIDPRRCLDVQEREVQEDLRRGLRPRTPSTSTQKDEDRGDRGRRHHRGHRLQALRRDAESRTTATGSYPNVYHRLEVERLVNASGPTGGEVVLRDGETPKSVGIIHCVGSRDENTNALVLARLLHVLAEARAPGQGAHRGRGLQLLHRHAHAAARATRSSTSGCMNEGVHFIRGRVAEVTRRGARRPRRRAS